MYHSLLWPSALCMRLAYWHCPQGTLVQGGRYLGNSNNMHGSWCLQHYQVYSRLPTLVRHTS